MKPIAVLISAGALMMTGCSSQVRQPETVEVVDTEEAAEIPTFRIDQPDGQTPWTHLDLNNDPANFQFAIVTDRTGGAREGVFEDAVNKLNLLQPEFVISVGDLIEGYTEDLNQLNREWNEFDQFVEALEMPFFYVPGNHDITNQVMANLWTERLGPTNYHFLYHDVLFIVLNSNEDGNIHQITEEQVNWLRDVLADNPAPRWTLVFIHAPLWDRNDSSLWPDVEALLEGRPHTAFAGHAHRYVKHQRKGSNYFTLGTTGGSSALRGPRFGEFDHVVWVTMTDEGPVLANLLLEGIWNESVRTESTRDFQDLVADEVLKFPPVLYRGDSFDGGSTVLRLRNDSNLPFVMNVNLTSLLQIRNAPPASVTVPPNELREIVYEFNGADGFEDESIVGSFDWRLSYLEDEETIEFSGDSPLGLVRERAIPFMDGIEVDGDLSEWSSLPFEAEFADGENNRAYSGPDDASFAFNVAQDDTYLHFAVRVNDPERVSPDGNPAWMRDYLRITADSRPARLRLTNISPYGRWGGFFRYMFLPLPSGELDTELPPEEMPKGLLHALRSTEFGYEFELAIPHALLDEHAGGSWDGVRINVSMTDMDPDEDRILVWWNPSWNTPASVPGSGSFHR